MTRAGKLVTLCGLLATGYVLGALAMKRYCERPVQSGWGPYHDPPYDQWSDR